MKLRKASAKPVRAALIVYAVMGFSQRAMAGGPELFRVSSPAFSDNGMMAPANAAVGKSVRGSWTCGGENMSPPLEWFDTPPDTKSFAIVMQDPEAQLGMGALHWLTYNIPPTVHGVAAGDANRTPDPFSHGDLRTKTAYSGPCSEPGATPHHYAIKVFALNLAPTELAPGLSLDDFMRQIKGHSLGAAGMVARYTPPSSRADDKK